MIKNVIGKIQNRISLHRYVHPFNKKNASRAITKSNTIALFCQPRSGSTWLSEILLTLPNTGIIDEPLWRGYFRNSDQHPNYSQRKIKEAAALNFYHYQPIPEDALWDEAKSMFRKILSGQTPSVGMYNELPLTRLKSADLFVAKFNFAQLSMHWLIRNFDITPILFLRHPCAVIYSQMNLPNFFRDAIPKTTMVPHFKYNEIYKQYAHVWKEVKSTEAYLAFLWSINVKHSLHHPGNNSRWLTVAYENLLTDYEVEVKRIFEFVGRAVTSDALAMHSVPSSSVQGEFRGHKNINRQLIQWKEKLKSDQIKSILKIVKLFGIQVYTDELMPEDHSLYKNYGKLL